jgi:hypothetical protein
MSRGWVAGAGMPPVGPTGTRAGADTVHRTEEEGAVYTLELFPGTPSLHAQSSKSVQSTEFVTTSRPRNINLVPIDSLTRRWVNLCRSHRTRTLQADVRIHNHGSANYLAEARVFLPQSETTYAM